MTRENTIENSWNKTTQNFQSFVCWNDVLHILLWNGWNFFREMTQNEIGRIKKFSKTWHSITKINQCRWSQCDLKCRVGYLRRYLMRWPTEIRKISSYTVLCLSISQNDRKLYYFFFRLQFLSLIWNLYAITFAFVLRISAQNEHKLGFIFLKEKKN